MIRRGLLAIAILAFVGWLAVLAVTVQRAGTVTVVSRAQFIAATHFVVVDIDLNSEGKPAEKAKVVEVIAAEGTTPGAEIIVSNLPSALVAGGKSVPAGPHVLFLTKGTGATYRIAGLPRSPGVEATPERAEGSYRPVIYPWNDDVRAQLRAFGLLK